MYSDKSDVIYNQSGVIPYRTRNNQCDILLITSLRRKRWIIPKGIIEGGLSARQSALKEAFEEAGIEGILDPGSVGKYSYKKWGGVCQVTVYACQVIKEHHEWPEMGMRERRWSSSEEVVNRINDENLLKLVRKFITQKCPGDQANRYD
jgi:8-oxo-dGTP pyrophosphatase MutT (NUDIX family)